MACDVTSFRLRFPEFLDDTIYPDPRIQLFLDDTLEDIGTDEYRWCGKYNRAHCYYAAHLLILGTKTEVGDVSATSGAVTSKSAGGVSIGRTVVAKDLSSSDDMLSTTSYGQQFMVIRNGCFAGVLVTC